jgi:cholesterol oxidase
VIALPPVEVDVEAPEFADNVIVGSGFGGSVMAYRLAAEGKEVCLLERGKAYAPGDFPRDPRRMAQNLWDPSGGRLGLFDIWSFRRLDVILSSGLGGGSLIYANVLFRKPPEWFVQQDGQPWPIGYGDLEDHYGAVEGMLKAERFPAGKPGFEQVKKAVAMREAAEALQMHSEYPKLAVAFGSGWGDGGDYQVGAELPDDPEYSNYHHKPRRTCSLCGQCDIGCNTGSKNTLDHTYLSAAKHKGAGIVPRCEVRSFEPAAGGYAVRYVYHGRDSETGRPVPTGNLEQRTIRCRRLILAAGSLGTTFLLLRMRSQSDRFDRLSPLLGHRFSGNGDYLAIMRRARTEDGQPRILNATWGPVITTAIRVDEGRGGFIEDTGYPLIVDWFYEAGRPNLLLRTFRFALRRFWSSLTAQPKSNLSGDVAGLIGDGLTPATSMPLAAMGMDVADGVMSLRNDRFLDIKWKERSSRPHVKTMERNIDNVARALHADRPKRSAWHYWGRAITVHPLGGCPIGTTWRDGVADQFGEVFNYSNLFVVDGSAMPGPIGANPSLTIAAFADRAASAILDGRAGV